MSAGRAPSVVVPADTVGAFVGAPGLLLPGRAGGPLHGCRLGVKDLFDVAGSVTGAGNPAFAAMRTAATASAPAVERLVAAGATVVGKTITDELAYSLSGTNVHFGTPANVRAPGRVPGGSSAGSAAAVAAGLVDLALGTDTGGSIRVPASYCGILGWRPTHGAVTTEGVVPLAPSFDTVGLLADDAVTLLAGAVALLGLDDDADVDNADDAVDADDVEGADGAAPLRLTLLGEALADVEPAIADACAAAVPAGTPTIELGVDLGAALGAFRHRQGWEAWQTHGAWIAANPPMGPGIASRFAAAAAITAADVARADEVGRAVRDAVVGATADGTVLVQPAAAGAAPGAVPDSAAGREAHERRRMQTLRLTCLAGLAGAPVVVLPLASDARDGDLPLGVAFVGAPGSDLRLLRWAVERMAAS